MQVHADASAFVSGISKKEAYAQVLEQAEALMEGQRNWVSCPPSHPFVSWLETKINHSRGKGLVCSSSQCHYCLNVKSQYLWFMRRTGGQHMRWHRNLAWL